MKQTLLLLAAFFIFIVGTAVAGEVDLDVTCPASVKAGSALTVSVGMVGEDDDCKPVIVDRIMMSLVGNRATTTEFGNKGGTLSGAGLWGPYFKALSPAVSAPSCTEVPVTKNMTVIKATPAALGGTGAMVMVQAVDPKGKDMGTGSCAVNVLK